MISAITKLTSVLIFSLYIMGHFLGWVYAKDNIIFSKEVYARSQQVIAFNRLVQNNSKSDKKKSGKKQNPKPAANAEEDLNIEYSDDNAGDKEDVIDYGDDVIADISDPNIKKLVYCLGNYPKNFDPAQLVLRNTLDIIALPIFNRLIEFDETPDKFKASLATKWEVSADGREYVFHLRKGVEFHENYGFKPERSFMADDIIFTFERLKNLNHPYHLINKFSFANSLALSDLIKNVKKLDDYKVKFTLNFPFAPFLSLLALDFASIQSAEYAGWLRFNKYKYLSLINNPIGTGKFKLLHKYTIKNHRIMLERHNKYFATMGDIERIIFKIIPSSEIRSRELIRNKCHVISNPNPIDIETFKKNKDIKTNIFDGLNIAYLAFNSKKESIDIPEVRRALGLLINRRGIINGLFRGRAEAAYSPLPKKMWHLQDEAYENLKYNPKEASKLLNSINSKKLALLKSKTLKIIYPYSPKTSGGFHEIAVMIKKNWEKVGIKSQVIGLHNDKFFKYLKDDKADYDAVLLSWQNDNADPDSGLFSLLSCASVGQFNFSNWCYLPFDVIIKRARKTFSQTSRFELYRTAHTIFYYHLPFVPLFSMKLVNAHGVNVKGIKFDMLGRHIIADGENID